MTTKNKVAVYSTDKAYEADMVKHYLSDHDIESFIMNKKDSAYHFGEIEVLVDGKDVIRSKKLMEEYNKK